MRTDSCDPQPQHREAEDEHEVDQVLDELAGRGSLPEMPDCAAHQLLAPAKDEVNHAKHDNGRAKPQPTPRELPDGSEEGDPAAAMFGAG